MRLLNFAGPLIAAVLSAGLVAGCVAPAPPQVDAQILNISTFEVLVAPDPLAISWPLAEEEYLASKHLDRNIGGVDQSTSSEGRTFVRQKAANTLRTALQETFGHAPRGSRPVTLRVTILLAHVLDGGEKVLGGILIGPLNHKLMCEAMLLDTKTGQVLAQTKELFAMEQATGGGVAGVVAGAIIESQRVGETFGRLSANYANKLYRWIFPLRG
jgi:hypothetical protein